VVLSHRDHVRRLRGTGGFDLGAGIVHYSVARNEKERRIVLGSLGPVWNGNEVWLLGSRRHPVLAFPAVYASSFQWILPGAHDALWLLILRGLSIEFRSYIDDPGLESRSGTPDSWGRARCWLSSSAWRSGNS